MRPARHGTAICAIRRRRFRRSIRRQRLFVSAAGHSDGSEYRILEEFWKRSASYIYEELLSDGVPTAGVAPLRSGRRVDKDPGSIGRLLTVQDLNQRGNRSPGSVAWKAVDRHPRGMSEELAQRYFSPRGELVPRHFPAFQISVHVG